MPFYKCPTDVISQGDIFPSIPFPIILPPVKVARPSPFQPKAGRRSVELRQIYTLPAEPPGELRILSTEGEETLSKTRSSKAIFLTWGSDVEDDERRFADRRRVGKRGWLAAPVHELLQEIPAGGMALDPDTRQETPVRDLIRRGKILHWFYLPPFPGIEPQVEHFASLRDITNIGAEFFRTAIADRIVTLEKDPWNELMTQVVWIFTRAEFLFRPIRCECGREVQTDVRFEGQNFDD